MADTTTAGSVMSAGPLGGDEHRPAHGFGRWWDRWGITAVLGVLVLVATLSSSHFLTVTNLQSILSESAYTGIVAIGMTFAIISGTFDLSVGGQLALVSICTLIGFAKGGLAGAITAAVVSGLLCGLFNALLITGLRVPPFVATLGTLFIFRGLATILGPHYLAYKQLVTPFGKVGTAKIVGVPLVFCAMLVCYGVASVVLRRTAVGRRVVSFGSSQEAARFCGISETRVRFFVFTLLGLTVALASLTYVPRVVSADAGTGTGFELAVIASVVLGGTTLKGGKGTLLGTFSAVLLLGVLNNVLGDHKVQAPYQRIALGCVLIAALAMDGLRGRMSGWRPRRRTTARSPA